MANNAQTIQEQVLQNLPAAARRAEGPYAVIECFQSIPCNPCYTFCKLGAVKPLTNINDLPEVDFSKCSGCGLCVPHCPGLAIFIVDESFSADQALVKIPYEYLPLPEQGSKLDACDRDGKYACRATVHKVQSFKNQTALVSLAVPQEYAHVARGVCRPAAQNGLADCRELEENPGESFICRCEDITKEELQAILAANNLTLSSIKLRTRTSMGPCQGRTCTPLILQEISRMTNKPINELRATSQRVPIKPVTMGALAGLQKNDAKKR